MSLDYCYQHASILALLTVPQKLPQGVLGFTIATSVPSSQFEP
jgi:hypothetical protein